MAVLAVDNYLALVTRSGLVEAARLAEALREFEQESGGKPTDCEVLSKRLLDKQLVTPWQNEKLMQGRHKGFFLGKYKLLSLLGTGGMSSVYLGEHTLMRRRVAIKVLPKQHVKESSYLERFFREARAIASLDHPNIVQAFNVDNENNTYYIVMEYVAGEDLEKVVQREGPLPYGRAVDYIRQAADGLSHAHSREMIHRDIKPSNLLLDREGTVKILDMGLARLTGLGERALTIEHNETVLGTTDYLAPEQAINSHNSDLRADIYSLGCTLYYLLTGHPPFPEGTLAQRLMKHQTQEPESVLVKRPDAPPDLLEIYRKMTAKKAADRHQTAAEVSEALGKWQAAHGIDTVRRRGADTNTTQGKSSTSGILPQGTGLFPPVNSYQPEASARNLTKPALPKTGDTAAAVGSTAKNPKSDRDAASVLDSRPGPGSKVGSPSASRAGRGSSLTRAPKKPVPPVVLAAGGAGGLALVVILYLVFGSGGPTETGSGPGGRNVSSHGTSGRNAKGTKKLGAAPIERADYALFEGFPAGSLHTLSFTVDVAGDHDLILEVLGGPKNAAGRVLLDGKEMHAQLPLGDLSTDVPRDIPLGKQHLTAGDHTLGIDQSIVAAGAAPTGLSFQPWFLMGPFDNPGGNNFDISYPPEKEPFQANQVFDGKNGAKLSWQQMDFRNGQVHPLVNQFADNSNIAYFLFRKVNSAAAKKLTLYFGSDDGLVVWLNGEKVHEFRGGRGVTPYSDPVPATFKAGDNELLLKIVQGGGDTGFFFADQPGAGAPPMVGDPFRFALKFPHAK